ncbi:MAG: phosphoglycerate kinase [Patescibacteria group bacterium]|jgi:phosphoglycerate kinase
MSKKIHYIDEAVLKNKRVILRVDFNTTLNESFRIADDARIRAELPSLNFLLKGNNRLILISHLGRPKGHDERYSLRVVARRLQELMPGYTVKLVKDFRGESEKKVIEKQTSKEILILENIRFYQEEKENSLVFAKELASLGDVYVNDAFGVSHRTDASLVGITRYLPTFGGLLMKKEVKSIEHAMKSPAKPVVAILGGAKISTKIEFLTKLLKVADVILIGGGLANTFLYATGKEIGKSLCEYDEVERAKRILSNAERTGTHIVLPTDVICGRMEDSEDAGQVRDVDEIPVNKHILDIGPKTQASFGNHIASARTIIWTGPVGYIENPSFARGTDFIYYSITHNFKTYSIVGGGDTIAAIMKKEYLEEIDHISTGGGAMLEFIEKGTLPAIEALKR